MDARLLAPLQLEMDEGVRTQPQAERLQRDHVAGATLARLTSLPKRVTKKACNSLVGASKTSRPQSAPLSMICSMTSKRGCPLGSQMPRGRFPAPRHDEGRSGRKVLLDEGHPLIAGQRGRALSVLVAHLAQDNELLGGAGDEPRLFAPGR